MLFCTVKENSNCGVVKMDGETTIMKDISRKIETILNLSEKDDSLFYEGYIFACKSLLSDEIINECVRKELI